MANPSGCARIVPGSRAGARVFLFCSLMALVLARSAHADALSAVQVLRQGGCGGLVPLARPLHHSEALDQAAQQWALGTDLSVAAARGGFPQQASGVHVRAAANALLDVLRRTECRVVTDRSLREIGVFRRAPDVWLVLTPQSATAPVRGWARRHLAPEPAPAASPLRQATKAQLAARALALVNEARARGTRCGRRTFAPAP